MHYECLSSIEYNKHCEIFKLIKVFLKTSDTTKSLISCYELHGSSEKMAWLVVSNSVIPNNMQKSILQPH